MENGVSKVEEVESKVEDFGEDVNRTEITDEALEGTKTNNGVESAVDAGETVDGRKDKSGENGIAESVSVTVDMEETDDGRKDKSGGNDGVESDSVTAEIEEAVDGRKDKNDEDSVELNRAAENVEAASEAPSESQMVAEKAEDNPIEETISMKGTDEESTSSDTTRDPPIVIENVTENNNLVDSDEKEEKMLNLADVDEKKNESDGTASNQASEFEANEVVNDDSEERANNLLQVNDQDGESSSDNTGKDQDSALETVPVVGEKDEVKMLGMNDEQKSYADVVKDGPKVPKSNGIVDNVEPTVSPKVEKSEPIEHEAKQDTPEKKEPDPKPNHSLIPSSKPTTSTRPAGLGNGAPLLESAPRVVHGNNSSLQSQVIDEPTNGEPDETDDTREKLQMIRVKFLRLARRLGQTPHNVVVAQVLYRLGLAEQIRGRNGGRVAAFSFERASAMAEQLEAAGQEPLEFSCTIMVLGKTGVGKSATINSIFDEVKFGTDAFQSGTRKVQDVVGTVQGIKVRVIDTPGLLSSWADQRKNEKILHSVKRFIQKSPPDIVLYLDRLDMQTRDFGDMPLLKTITDTFGQSIWFNAIVVLTHAASAPPEGPNGTATSYDMFVTQRSHVVQQAIRQAAGDMRLMNPVSLVENHSACRTNRAGQRVLPNGQVWKPHLLLLSFASKILVEANMLLKLQDSPPGKPFVSRTRAPPLPYILSNLLQSRPQLKLPQEQFGDDDDVFDNTDESCESSDEESSEYDELPPFKRLSPSQLSKLSKEQKKSYYNELEYREKLFMKKQLKEEKTRRKMMKKMAEEAKNFPDSNMEEDGNGAATVPVAVQDMNLPASFDADNPTHRYRVLESANQWLIRPVLDPHGWDHDVGYEGINVEHLLAVKEKVPVSFSGQITKDKKDANLQMEVSSALKHGKSKSKSTTLAFDLQTVGKEMSYTLRSETRFFNHRKNKASAGFSATYFGDSLTGGLKFEDKLTINKRGQLVVAGGAVIGRGDVAYGGSLEATLRDKDYPLGRFLSTVGLSVMDWHGDLALGWNAQSQIPIGRFTHLIGRVNLNNKGSGQVSVRVNSSEQLQIALAAFVPLVSKLLGYYQDRDSSSY